MGLRLLAIACLVGAALAGPLQSESQCSTRCSTSSADKFNYRPGRKYVYDYQGVNHVVIAGHSKQKTQISARVEINVKSKCDLVLQMRDIAIEQKAPWSETEELARKLEIPLPYAFQDGKIEHLCPSTEETKQSLNIKRAVLSAFINSMDNLEESQELKEVDSLGTCQTRYTTKAGRLIVIEKEKDMKSCTNRHSSISSLMSNQYESPESYIHTVPIFPQEKLSCKEVIEDQVIKSTECHESSTIKPLPQKDSLIELKGHMNMRLIRVESSDNIRLPPLRSRESVLFNLEEETTVEDKKEEVKRHLREMCTKNAQSIDLAVSKDFIQLVSDVKRLPYESLQEIYSSLESGSLCSSKKLTDLFLDTLPMAGNDASIKLMVNILMEGRVSGLKAKLWSASLSLVSKPSHEAIAAVVPLITKQKSGSVLLGVSAMVYRYCSNNPCESSKPVKEIISTLNEVLGRQCSYESESEAIAVLKAFGNMGELLHAEQNILACAKDSDKSIRVRLTAIDAFRRVNKTKPEELLHLFADPQEHYEVRIAALSSVLRQADRQQLQLIKSVVERESDEQVSSYAGTLISNYNKTSCPLKKHVKHLLKEMNVETPAASYWQNSKNIELSTFSGPLNIGGSVESDVIHSQSTKIPRSIYTRFDMDVFDKHINVFEVGMRAEGLEAAFKKLIGFNQPQKQRSAWNLLSSSSEAEDDKVQASFFLRTMNTEIFDLSVDDLTGMGQMIKFADLLNKVSHDKSADFSHSFMFINSHLVIPSVTGRSYSFGMTGSATVGLTASSKLDIVNIMSKPKNCDLHGHFQPSVNVELAATVGIHSEKPRPDVKIVTRLHSESNIEAQFKIKDGHLGLFKVSMPSENVILTRVSSDIIEIDANHEERRLFENMQTKVDYCFDKLEKPFGVSICGKWEVPRPFLSKTFPFVKGVGNVELSIKKTDAAMQGYQISFEIPTHKSHLMKYTAAMDTPGSKINRRFSADLEVRSPSRDLKEFTMELQSPFRSARATATGALTMHHDLVEATVDLQAGSSYRYSLKASTPIAETASQKIYRPSIQLSSTSFQTLKVDGSVTVSKGSKQEISFDLNCNKPSSKPLALKGSIVKDGQLSWSKEAEWKLSTDVAVKTPMLNFKIRSSAEKQSKLSHTISTMLSLDYQKEQSRRQSMKLVTKVQKSSSKISSIAQFEATEFSFANFALTWNMQKKLKESVKNDISLKYGRNPESQYISIIQTSKHYEPLSGECKISVKAPQFNIDSEMSSNYEIKKNSKIHAEVDFRYKADQHIRSKLQLDNLSSKPLKLKVKAELQTPSRRIMYTDVLEEFASNSYRGNAIFQWREDKRAEFQYSYLNESDRSKMHHEIETSLRLPSWRLPLKHKSVFHMTRENVVFDCRMSLDRRSEFSLIADLNKRGSSYVLLKTPQVEGNLKLVNEKEKKAADMDLRLNLYKRPRHIIASTSLELKSQSKLEVAITFDADRNPEQKLLFASVFMNQRGTYFASSQVQVLDKVKMEMATSGDTAIFGKHEVTAKATLFSHEPVEIYIMNDMSHQKVDTVLRYSKALKPKLEMSVGGEYSKNRREYELSTYAAVKALDNSFQAKTWSSQYTFSQSKSSYTLKSNAKLELSPSKVYDSEISCDFQPNICLIKAYLHTPHRNFEKQLIGLSFRKSESLISSSANLELSNGKSISIESESQIGEDSLSSALTLKSSFDMLREAKALLELQNQKSQKSLKMSCEANGNMVVESDLNIQSSRRATEIKGRVKTSKMPELSMSITVEKNKESFKYDAQILKESTKLMTATLSKQVSGQEYLYALESSNQEKTFINLKISKDNANDKTTCMLEAQGPFPHVSLTLESSQIDRKSSSLGMKACRMSQEQICYYAKVYHKALIKEDNYIYYRKLTLDIEKSAGNSIPAHVSSINMLASIKEHEFKEKIIFESNDNKIGYDFRLHRRDNQNDHCSLESHIYMAKRVARIKGSALHNSKSVLLDFEVVPDVLVPSRKLGLELKKEMASKEVSGYLKLVYPGMRKPIELSGRIQKEGKYPVSGKVTLDSSAVGGQTFILDIIPGAASRRQNKRSVQYRLYSEDKRTELSATLTKYLSMEDSTFSYEWSLKTTQIRNEGKLSLKLFDKKDGIPRAFEVEIVSPRVTSKMVCQTTWDSYVPTGLYFSFGTINEKLAEMNVKLEDKCLIIEETLKSREYMTNRVCLWKTENTLKVISVQSSCQRKPCLEFEIEVDEHQPKLANINLKWNRRNIELALREARQFLTEVQSVYISTEDLRALKQSLRSTYEKSCEQLRQIRERVYQVASRHFNSVQERLIKAKQISSSKLWDILTYIFPMEYLNSEFVHRIFETVGCLWDKYVRFVNTHLPEMLRSFWQQIMMDIAGCLKSRCSRDSICYEAGTLLENFELEKAKMMVSRRLREAQENISMRLESADINDVLEYLAKRVEAIGEELRTVLEKIFGGEYVERMINYWREKEPIVRETLIRQYKQFVAWVRRMIWRAEQDEDYRVLKSLAVEAKEKAIRAWRQRESLIKNSKESLENTFKELPRKMVENNMTIRKFAPKEGSIQIQIKNPIERKHVLILKNAFISMKNKILSEFC